MKRVNASEPFHEQEGELQNIVEASLRGDLVDATVTVTNGAGEELAMRGKRIDDTITLTSVDRDWVVRAIASIAGSVIAVDPAGVREDVVKLLRSAKGKDPHEH